MAELLEPLRPKLRTPLGIILGSPREAADLVAACDRKDAICYQMDLHQAERLREELDARGLHARVATRADLWDLPEPLHTLVFPVAKGGERLLKLDMIEWLRRERPEVAALETWNDATNHHMIAVNERLGMREIGRNTAYRRSV